MTDDDEPITIHLIRRSLPQQVEYLIIQVAVLVGRVRTLEAQVEDLNARLKAVERATPLRAPKKPHPG